MPSRRDLPEHVRASIARIGEQLAHKPATLAATPASTLAPDVAPDATPEVRIRLVLPSPPSANRYWRVPRALGRPILSREARDYKARVADLGAEAGLRSPFACEVSVRLVWTRPRRIGDLDNILKPCFDALKGIAYVDDKLIVHFEARRQDRDKGEPGLVVEVRAA